MQTKFRLSILLASLLFVVAGSAGARTFITLSSATYNGPADLSDYGNGVAVDVFGNIIVAGSTGIGTGQQGTIMKYDSNLTVISSVTFSEALYGTNAWYAVTTDASGNIIAAGYINGATEDMFVAKYDPNLVMISSAAFDGPAGGKDAAAAVAVDGLGNIVLAGYANSSPNEDIWVIKCDASLNELNATRLAGAMGGDDEGCDVVIDGSNSIIVAGFITAANWDFCTIKFSPTLTILSSATYNGPDDDYDQALGVAVDAQGNIIVAGESGNAENDSDFLTIKYSPDFTLLSSARYNGDNSDVASSVVLDPSGNMIVTGYSDNGSDTDYLTIKYDRDLVVISSAQYNGGNTDFGQAAAVDGAGNIIITGGSSVGNSNYFTIKYNGAAPSVTQSSPVSGVQGSTVDAAINGGNFLPGAVVAVSGAGITINTTNIVSKNLIQLNFTIAENAAPGKRDLSITNTDGTTTTLPQVFEVKPAHIPAATGSVDTGSAAELTINPESGDISVAIAAGTFSQAVSVTVSTSAVPVSTRSTVKVGSICLEITNNLNLQPGRPVTITVNYRDADISGLDESKLILCRYDAANNLWIPLPTTVDAVNNVLTATTNHLSTFVLVQLAPAADLAGVKAYPNPFNPENGSITIANLTGEADIKIYTVAGELVRTLQYTSANGQAIWDGKNDAGGTVASGVYLAFIKSDNGKKIIKIAVER